MATWNSRGLRGSELEELINRTNEKYREKRLCLVQKIPTPITPVEFEKESRTIKLAYFGEKSTVDYIGAAQGIPLCFDAKECAVDTFTLRNIHAHQVAFMDEFESQGGIAFFLIHYTGRDVFYYLRFQKLKEFWQRYEEGGRRSFRFEEIEEEYILERQGGIFIPYLEKVQLDLDNRP
ncbi:MAG: Holliday junction resolvase RecU [Lachnospiraceae bacterium]|nr:Holliday junction resolvase RecU [Lachnospiraceae bacterium]